MTRAIMAMGYNGTLMKKLKEKKAEGYVDTAIKILIAVVLGALLLAGLFASGGQYPLFQGTCIGNRRICQLQDPFALQNPLLNDTDELLTELQVQITAARDEVILKDIQVY